MNAADDAGALRRNLFDRNHRFAAVRGLDADEPTVMRRLDGNDCGFHPERASLETNP